MKFARRAILAFFSLPGLMQIGFVILALGGSLDFVYHAAPSSWIGTLELYLGHEGYNAHLVTFIGMLIMLAGVLIPVLRPRWSTHRHRPWTEHSD